MEARKLTSPMRYQHYALIEGNFSASDVLNCLRYDRAMPFEEVDAHILERSIRHNLPFRLVITKFAESAKTTVGTNSVWTVGKWSPIKLTPITASEAMGMESGDVETKGGLVFMRKPALVALS